jgi:hypothetical protein
MAGGRVGVGPDIPAALRALQSVAAPAGPASGGDSALTAARAAFLAVDSAARIGDWVTFGRAMEKLRRALGAPGGRKP